MTLSLWPALDLGGSVFAEDATPERVIEVEDHDFLAGGRPERSLHEAARRLLATIERQGGAGRQEIAIIQIVCGACQYAGAEL